MNRSYFRQNFTLLATIVALLLISSLPGIAEDATSTLSGRVVDVEGNPVAGFALAVQPFEVVDGVEQRGYIPFLESQTGDAGRFSITNIMPVSVQLVALPHYTPDHEILSIKIGAVTVYKHELPPPPFGGITFSIKPGIHIENVEVKVKPRMRIQGRIVFADGTPLANAKIGVKARFRYPDGMGSGSSSSSAMTDDVGYFVKYMEQPGFYTVWLEFQGLSATAEPFLLQVGERKDDLVFTLEGESIPTDVTPGRVEASAEASTSSLPGAGVWVVNPGNGHAYKSIRCKSWDDANIQAVAEEAHLVAINDVAEQKWLAEIFGSRPYWIGLTDFAKEGKWQWTNGEPVTYTNWAPHEPTDTDMGEEDYVFMGNSLNGEWSDVGPESAAWRFTRMAIIERDNLPTKTPVKEK